MKLGTSDSHGKRTHPREEKRMVVKIAKKVEAEAIKDRSREDIARRIQRVANESQGNRTEQS